MKFYSFSLSFVAALAILALPHKGTAQTAARKPVTSAHASAKPAPRRTTASKPATASTAEQSKATAGTESASTGTASTPAAQPESASGSKASSASAKTIFWGPMPSGSKWDKGAFIGQVGLGIGSPYYAGTYGLSIPVFVAADYGVHPRIGVGGVLGYSRASYDYGFGYTGSDYRYRRSAVTVGARGTYHIALKPETFDLYAGVLVGLNFITYSYPTVTVDQNGNAVVRRNSTHSVGLPGGAFLGARWYFSPNIALFGEVGASVAYLSGGVAFKIN